MKIMTATKFYTRGDKVRVIDKAYTNSPLVWNRDLYVAWESDKHVHVVDNLHFPVFINYFEKTQLIKIENGKKEYNLRSKN